MALEFSTAGAKLLYCVETTSGTRPTTGFTNIPDVKSTPELNPSPSTLDVTTLADQEWRRSIPGLKDVGGPQAITANNTAAFQNAWATLVTAAETALTSSKSTWFEIKIPGFKSFFFSGMPSDLGINGLEVDAVLELDAYITPNKIEGWAESSTSEASA